LTHNTEMTADQAFKHFDSAQCDIRVIATLVLLWHSLSIIYNVMLSGVEAQKGNLSVVAESKDRTTICHW
jgi:hypothetical protein